MKVSDYAMKRLAGADVQHLFMLPGGGPIAPFPPTLGALLREPSECGQAVERLRRPFEELVGDDDETGPVLLFGCGPLGRHTAAQLRVAGRSPVAFVDNAEAAWGSSIQGIPVLSPAEAVDRFRDEGLFVVTIFNGAAVRTQLEAMGCKRVLHFASLYFGSPELFIPYYQLDWPQAIFAARDEILAVEPAWADDLSRTIFAEQLAARLGFEPSYDNVGAARDCYFDPALFTLDDRDCVVDCGAFDGDTIRQVLAKTDRAPRRIVALEPDPANARALRTFVAGLDPELMNRISVLEAAASAEAGTISFDPSGTVAARAGEGMLRVKTLSLDALAADVEPTYIKMDIEGHEFDALRGAVDTLQARAPILAISLYHRSDDLWRIPAFIKKVNPSYRVFLRCYAEDGWESVCYAVPEHRLPVSQTQARP